MTKYASIILLAVIVGCGETQPPELQNAMVTVVGKPNAEVYLAVEHIGRTVNGRESATTGFSNYGVRRLDENGRFEDSYDSDHGLDVVLVAMDDDPLTLSVTADNMADESAEVSGQFTFAHLQLGYRPDPDSMFAAKPDNCVDSAKEHLQKSTAEE